MAPAEKGGRKRGRYAVNRAVTQEYKISIHKRARGVGFKKRAPGALKDIQKFAMKEMGAPDVCTDTAQQSCLGKSIGNVPHGLCEERLSRKGDEGDDSMTNKLYAVVPSVPVTTFNNLHMNGINVAKMI
uniref:Uncharacterized protein n=1 Tax=Otolemur garnettii TaxID=30611 RepID=H0Y131_OTOGA